MANRRLTQLLKELDAPPAPIGTLKLGDISYDVPASRVPSRLPHSTDILLDVQDTFNLDNLHFILQKYLLGQDVFLLSQPGPYARRLALTFCSLINSEYEYVALHRDVGETELKQGREIRAGGNLVYVDSAAVRAVKHGRILIIEGIEKAERGIMPVLNNLLENREMNLDDGTHIIHPHRYALLDSSIQDPASGKLFIPAHKNFRVIAIAAPVPPYPGYPLDPPFRSRFQARFIDPVGALLALSPPVPSAPHPLFAKLRDLIVSTQYASEARHALDTAAKSVLPAFPQTAVAKLRRLLEVFPPPAHGLTPEQLARLILTIHPALIHAPFVAWAMLARQLEDAGIGALGSPSLSGNGDNLGLLGYRLSHIERISERTARITFSGTARASSVSVEVPAGPKSLLAYPFVDVEGLGFLLTERFVGLFTALLQAHALGWDVAYVPPALPSTASCSTTTLVRTFAAVLGYELEDYHMYKELGGRELLMRRRIEDGGATSWEPSPLIEGVWAGRLVHLSGIDVIGSTAGSLARLMQDRETELWEGKRIVWQASEEEQTKHGLSVAHPSFRIISTASRSVPLKDWLSDEQANMFFPIAAQPMSRTEEAMVLAQTGCPPHIADALLSFAERYRASMTSDTVQKNRKLGTRALVRIARRVARFPGDDDLYALLSRAILADFLPTTELMNLEELFAEAGIKKRTPAYNPPPVLQDGGLFFPEPSDPNAHDLQPTFIPAFDRAQDPEGVASHVPYMDHFYDNSLQTGLMRDMAVDLEILGEHLVLLGNQGVGKNKIIDRCVCRCLLNRPREYIQLHRDTTVNQLMFQTVLENGLIKYTDSPLLRAIVMGRVIVVDEADKAAEHVVAIFRSLAGHGQLTLADGRRVRREKEREGDLVVHPNFRLILLANRPGYPFLGNHFLQVLGDNFSCHAVNNPDMNSERKLLSQLAPDMDEDMILRLVAAFQDLRRAYESGSLTYPYSLRELINIVRHMQKYPLDSLEATLRNVFDFDVYKPETIDKLAEVLDHHGLAVKRLDLDAAREASRKKVLDIKFEPKGDTDLSSPKVGEVDPQNKAHTGGNRWAGGTGGRDTAGLGGRGGYMRLFKGHDINQVSDELKQDVPEHIKEQAREMARQELARRLEELDMSPGEAKGYGALLTAVEAHISQLHDLLENLAAKEEERVWVKRQTDGELDDSRLTEGLTGEATVYKRRSMAKPELGRPQIKPKRIRFVFDISASMCRFQYDGRLQRSMETAVMLMETFNRLTRKDKYVWDIYGHSGDSAVIPLVESDNLPTELKDRWKVIEKMELVSQYAFAGDYTVEAIDKAVNEVAKFDAADDWFVITITDANFGRYGITAEEVHKVMTRQPKVNTALICIGEGAEAVWVPKKLQGRGFRVSNTTDIPAVLRSILTTMVDRG
ncbi:uncharacterized protein LAESUDRAFT_649814 [Laetiporus sulphureus 93-53]|uniref:ATPase dynein-related AAA domain-containing protein n=1 Tax=Laetiporus sulphureus 93-53 TaxID=1314785 RepID=A0A165F0R3_9APHY|nr:uncharacterized protein LAESUDRAFT_649814 [Laetiporus sulphureus 93-53]KZT08123.1 hypothetical protein LAESUDRAFT_649814 [Laetiporus sulphureus 93-53]